MSRQPNQRPRRPEHVDIQPQRMDFDFQNVPRYWFGGDPVRTHFLNALSLTFPEGERFFVDSVRALRQEAVNARQEEISGFIGQEAMHSKEHRAFNELLEQQGYGRQARGGEGLALRFLNDARKYLGKRQQLAVTAGLEHITAILANHLLKDGGMVEEMDLNVRNLWVWHAIEETEHKAVAFDVLQQISGNYRMRTGIFLTVTTGLGGYAVGYTWRFLKRDGLHRDPKTLAGGLWKLFGWKGFITRLIPDYLEYLRPGFHPWNKDNSELIEQWRAVLNGYEGTGAAA